MNLVLNNGTEIFDAHGKLIRFMEAEYDLYDGVGTLQDNRLTLFDVLLSIMMNSRLDTANKVRSVWNGRAPVEEALGEIPSDIALQDEDIPWDRLRDLFDAFCGIPWAGPAVSTKVLHKKRPLLIPVLDSVLAAYITGYTDARTQRGISTGTRMVHAMQYIRSLLQGNLDEIQTLCTMLADRGFYVSPVRALEALLWIENESTGYYLTCPNCHNGHVIPIRYGEPTRALAGQARRGEVLLRECAASPSSPKWHCIGCKNEWGRITA